MYVSELVVHHQLERFTGPSVCSTMHTTAIRNISRGTGTKSESSEVDVSGWPCSSSGSSQRFLLYPQQHTHLYVPSERARTTDQESTKRASSGAHDAQHSGGGENETKGSHAKALE